MSLEITTAFVQQYRSNVELLCQQKGGRLRGTVREESQAAEYAYYEQIGATEAQARTSRHSNTPQVDTPHSRRRVGLTDYDWADFVDAEDKIRLLIDPTSPYALNASYAMGRAMDDEIIAAVSGTAYTGKTGSTSVALPSAQKIAHGSAGLNLTKLLEAKEILDAAEVDEMDTRYFVVTAAQMTDLLNTTEIKDTNYNTVQTLVRGQVDEFLGFKFVRSQRLTHNGTSRLCLAYASSGVLLAVGQNPTARISERPDKNYLTQVFFSMAIGATRMEEAKIVEVACNE